MTAMKLAVVPLPNEKSCEFVLKQGEVAPPILFVNGSKQFAVLAVLFLCALGLFYSAYHSGIKSTLTAVTQPTAEAQRFDGKRPLKAGELVMVNGATATGVRQVAAAPKEAVLLRQGNSLRALYMTGEKKYVVISGNETRIVPASQIQAVVPRAANPAP